MDTKALTLQDLLDVKAQVDSWGIKPTTIWMHPDTWALLSDHVKALYVAILKRGGIVRKQETLPNGDIVVEVETPGVETLESFYLEAK